MALPEAFWINEFEPLAPPLNTPMFDLREIPLYFWFTDPPIQPNIGPQYWWRRDWEAPEWCFLPTTPPEAVPFRGSFRYSVWPWPAGIPGQSTFPNPEVILHEFFITWDTWAASSWRFGRVFSTLTGTNSYVGWDLLQIALGLASPPCTFGLWNNGWAGMDIGPVPWSALSEPFTYAESEPHIFV